MWHKVLFAATLLPLPEPLSEHTALPWPGLRHQGRRVGGGGCFNDRGKASFQGVFRQKASQDCVLDHWLGARLGSLVGLPGVLEPRCLALFCTRGLACAECGLYLAVFRETRGQPLQRWLSNFVINFGSLLLQDRVAVHPGGQIPSAGPDTAEHVRALLD